MLTTVLYWCVVVRSSGLLSVALGFGGFVKRHETKATTATASRGKSSRSVVTTGSSVHRPISSILVGGEPVVFARVGPDHVLVRPLPFPVGWVAPVDFTCGGACRMARQSVVQWMLSLEERSQMLPWRCQICQKQFAASPASLSFCTALTWTRGICCAAKTPPEAIR